MNKWVIKEYNDSILYSRKMGSFTLYVKASNENIPSNTFDWYIRNKHRHVIANGSVSGPNYDTGLHWAKSSSMRTSKRLANVRN